MLQINKHAFYAYSNDWNGMLTFLDSVRKPDWQVKRWTSEIILIAYRLG